LFGSSGFIGIVAYLHIVQGDYDPVHQLMSELALGEQGNLMLAAFTLLALAASGAIGILATFNNNKLIFVLLSAASASLLGAGVFTLVSATTLHITLVGLAFVLLGLVMYLVPRYISAFQNVEGKLVSWDLGLSMAVAVSLGHNFIPIGVGQRLAAACLLMWLCWLTIFALRHQSDG